MQNKIFLRNYVCKRYEKLTFVMWLACANSLNFLQFKFGTLNYYKINILLKIIKILLYMLIYFKTLSLQM